MNITVRFEVMKLAEDCIHGRIGKDQRLAGSLMNKCSKYFFNSGNIFSMNPLVAGAGFEGLLCRWWPTAEASEEWTPTGADLATPAFN